MSRKLSFTLWDNSSAVCKKEIVIQSCLCWLRRYVTEQLTFWTKTTTRLITTSENDFEIIVTSAKHNRIQIHRVMCEFRNGNNIAGIDKHVKHHSSWRLVYQYYRLSCWGLIKRPQYKLSFLNNSMQRTLIVGSWIQLNMAAHQIHWFTLCLGYLKSWRFSNAFSWFWHTSNTKVIGNIQSCFCETTINKNEDNLNEVQKRCVWLSFCSLIWSKACSQQKWRKDIT